MKRAKEQNMVSGKSEATYPQTPKITDVSDTRTAKKITQLF